MDSDHEFAQGTLQEEATLSLSAKRSLSPLFVEEDQAPDAAGDNSNKRRKTDTSSMKTPPPSVERDLTEDGKVPGYNAAKAEGRPRLAIYHPSFKIAEAQVKEVCAMFTDVVVQLEAEHYFNEEIRAIVDHNMSEVRNPIARYPVVKPVACYGPSGVGKSSAMNSILNQKKAAAENDSGRGTYVVHEYMTTTFGQMALYEVRVPYLRPSQIQKMVEKHYSNITEFLQQPEDLDAGEADELQAKYDTAMEFFCALLRDRDDFESHDEAESYFEGKRSEDAEDVVEELMGYIEEFLGQRKLKDCEEIFTAETAAELSDIFKKVSRPGRVTKGRQIEPSPWPLIKKVQVHQESDLLDTGVILADTAGVSDVSGTVVDNTVQYIKDAGTVLVFSGHRRIEKEPLVDKQLREVIQLGKMHETALVVTMIDTKQVYKDDEKEDLPAVDRALLEDAEKNLTSIKREEQTLSRSKKTATDQDFRRISDRLEETKVQKATAETALKQLAVQIRCREIKENLKGRLKKLEKSKAAPELPIYFISSKAYQQHVDGYDPCQPPDLDVKATGIPGLRAKLYDVPARGKINTLRRICKNRLPSIFNGILGVLTKSKLERKDEVEKLIIKVLGRQIPLVDGIVGDTDEHFQARILKAFKDNEAKWKEKAEKLLAGWSKYKAVTFTAFCRRSGHWKLPNQSTKEIFSWNGLIQNIFDNKMTAEFDLLVEDVDSVEKVAISNVDQLFKDLKDSLEACEEFQGVDMQPFFGFINDTRDNLFAKVSTLCDDLKKEINDIRHTVTLDTKFSFVAAAMEDTYQECLKSQAENYQTFQNRNRRVHKKTRAHDLRVDLVRDKLTGNTNQKSVFASVANLAGRKFEEELKKWGDRCRDQVAKSCKSILTDFNRRFEVPEVKSEENQEAVQKLQEAATKALEVINGSMREHIEQCEAYERGDV